MTTETKPEIFDNDWLTFGVRFGLSAISEILAKKSLVSRLENVARGSYNGIPYGFKSILGLNTPSISVSAKQRELTDDDMFAERYFYGFPGLVVGGMCALPLAFVYESHISFRALSGSIFNTGIEYPLFKGIDGDRHKNRSVLRHLLGTLGYIPALTIAVPALVIFIARYVPSAIKLIQNIRGCLQFTWVTT